MGISIPLGGGSGSGGGSSPTNTERLDLIENRLAVNTLRDQVADGWTVLDMIEGTSDEFHDSTGVDAANTTFTYLPDTDSYTTSEIETKSTTALLLNANIIPFVDSSIEPLAITNNGGVNLDTGTKKYGAGSAFFNSNNDRLEVPVDTKFDIAAGADFTIESWVNTIATSSTRRLYGSFDTATASHANGFGMVLDPTDDSLFFRMNYSGGYRVTLQSLASAYSKNTWFHLAVIRKSGVIRVCIDGTEITYNAEDRTGQNDAVPMDRDLWIGEDRSGAGSNTYQGFIDDFRISNGVARYEPPFTPPTAELVAVAETTPATATLRSEDFTASTVPTVARMVVLIEPVDAITINTDVVAKVSRDNGANFTTATLTEAAEFDSVTKVYTTDDIDLSALASGSDMVWQIEMANTKGFKVHGAWLQWR